SPGVRSAAGMSNSGSDVELGWTDDATLPLPVAVYGAIVSLDVPFENERLAPVIVIEPEQPEGRTKYGRTSVSLPRASRPVKPPAVDVYDSSPWLTAKSWRAGTSVPVA